MTSCLHGLSPTALRALASSLRTGPLSLGMSQHAVSQAVGNQAAAVEAYLAYLHTAGMTPQHIASLVEAIAEAQETAVDPERILELVISGPDVAGVPTGDTAATMRTLMAEANTEVLLVGYAVHNARDLFHPLAQRMSADARLRVVFCLDISRKPGDTAPDSEVVKRFAGEFRERHWPWARLPRVYFDPRSLAGNSLQRASLHAKCVVADRRTALITSANFTQAAQHRNIEVGVLARHASLAQRLCIYFEGLIATRQLVECNFAMPAY